MRLLFFGDIVGRPGRTALLRELKAIRKDYQPDYLIANAENASGGVGVNLPNATQLLEAGFDCLTGGNHTFQAKDHIQMFMLYPQVLRPGNYPPMLAGCGHVVLSKPGQPKLGVINVMGQAFMDNVNDPFSYVDDAIEELRRETPCILVDMHCETTSEKYGMGYHCDGRVSAVVGTHTQVQTADERIFPGGTAFICDTGPVAVDYSVIGMDREKALERMRTKLPIRLEVARGAVKAHGVIIDIDPSTGRALHIERVARMLGEGLNEPERRES
ncbi:MAG: 2',3'-cyclic-nucleotide 2'-phosphodiesterase [bacterium]|nr:2',3'-cyclic-nucleotide 2'-phosphodiesterase [bacterium]